MYTPINLSSRKIKQNNLSSFLSIPFDQHQNLGPHFVSNKPHIHYENNTTLSQVVRFLIEFVTSIQNVWITPLMMIYNTHRLIDCIIWVIPLFIAILIRPSLHTYATLILVPIKRYKHLICINMICIGIGCIIVGYSTTIGKSDHIIKIAICTIGWTIMDVGLELSQYFLLKADQYNCKNEDFKNSSQKTKCLGNLFGLSLPFFFFTITNASNLQEFFFYCKICYYLTGVLCFVCSIMFTNYQTPPDSQSYKETSFQCFKSAHSYLPGLQLVKKLSYQQKAMVIMHFSIDLITDVIMFYATMWITHSLQFHKLEIGQCYCIGIRDGSLLLATYSIVIAIIRINTNFVKAPSILGMLIVPLMYFGFMAFWSFKYQWIFLMVIGASTYVGIYKYHIRLIWQKNDNLFVQCIEIVERFQKIFSLMIMPTICLLLMSKDDVQYCIIFVMFALGFVCLKWISK